jgi:hypothetical protein
MNQSQSPLEIAVVPYGLRMHPRIVTKREVTPLLTSVMSQDVHGVAGDVRVHIQHEIQGVSSAYLPACWEPACTICYQTSYRGE